MFCDDEEREKCPESVAAGTGLIRGDEWDGCCEGLLTCAGILEGGRIDRDKGELAAS